MLLLRNVYMASAIIMIEPPRVAPNYVSMASDRAEAPKMADQLEGLAQKAFTDAWLEDLVRTIRSLSCAPDGIRATTPRITGTADQIHAASDLAGCAA